MKNRLLISVFFGLLFLGAFFVIRTYNGPVRNIEETGTGASQLIKQHGLKTGDVIFQTSKSSQSIAIQLATNSKYSHCGIIYEKDGHFSVLEAVETVKNTPLSDWIANGKDGHFVIKRLKNDEQFLTTQTIQKLKTAAELVKGKKYDSAFEWTDEKMYCSELVWKIYQRATGIEIGNCQKLGDFNLTDERVQRQLKNRYGDIIPVDELVISPAAIFKSDRLMMVKSNK